MALKFLFFFLIATSALAVSLDTLPQGVRSPQWRYGHINGLNQTFGADSRLWSLSDQHSIRFDAATLAQVNAQSRLLIQALNSFGSQNLGEDINIGTLWIDSKPELKYQAAIFAYGVTDRWTMAAAIPLIHYTNTTTVSSTPGNLDFYKSQFAGRSQALDQAFQVDVVAEAQKSLSQKGYLPLDRRDQKFVGDAQLVSLYRWELLGRPVLWQSTLVLPTGPEENPDDLLALNQFHRTEVQNLAAIGFQWSPQLVWKPYFALCVPLPDKVTKRIPKDDQDTLPDASQKQELLRTRGISATWGSELSWEVSRRWNLSTAYQFSSKARDKFSGDGSRDYDRLMARNSDAQAQEVKTELSYSTVRSYLSKESFLPLTISVALSDTVGGKNTPRQQTSEASVLLFF